MTITTPTTLIEAYTSNVKRADLGLKSGLATEQLDYLNSLCNVLLTCKMVLAFESCLRVNLNESE